MTLIHTTKDTYEKFLLWIKNARNYVGRPGHELDGESHYVTIDGKSVKACEQFFDDLDSEESYRVNNLLFDEWRELNSYVVGDKRK